MSTFDLDVIGTHLSLRIEGSSSCTLDEDFSGVRERLMAFEYRFSRFLAGNWLHELNMTRSAFLDDDARNMVVFALDLAKRTHGYFDPTIGKRLTELGYGNQNILHEEEISLFESTLALDRAEVLYVKTGDYRDIRIEGDHIELGKSIELEFGGVGKAYLLDVVSEMLEEYPRFLMNFGGDIFVRGCWKIGLESPFDPEEIVGMIELENRFLACSAGTKRKWGKHHHLIDPHTGASAREVIATYIEGDSGMLVDAYSTALSVMPWTLACETLESTPLIEGVLIREDGSLYQSKGSRSEVFS